MGMVLAKSESYVLQGYPYTTIYYYCPGCNKCYGNIDNVYKNDYYNHKFCFECGQELVWPEVVKEYVRRKQNGVSYTEFMDKMYDILVKEKENGSIL